MRERRGRGKEKTLKVCLKLNMHICSHVEGFLFPAQGHTDWSSKYLGNRCSLAPQQDVIRGWTRGK